MKTPLTKYQLLRLLNKAIPQPDRITHVDDFTEADAIYFRWRGLEFWVTTSLNVTESQLKVDTAHSLLMQALLRETRANH